MTRLPDSALLDAVPAVPAKLRRAVWIAWFRALVAWHPDRNILISPAGARELADLLEHPDA
jgi:hypothetical protein